MKLFKVSLFLFFAFPAFAGVTINVTESGSDVLMSHSGNLDTTGLSLDFANLTPNTWDVYPQSGALEVGTAATRDLYSGLISAGGSFGSGSFTSASSSAGDFVYISSSYIGLPINFISGSSLTGSTTFSGSSFASLGITTGTYTWTLPSDTITLNITGSTVPEPSTYAMLVGLSVLGFVAGRRRSRAFPSR